MRLPWRRYHCRLPRGLEVGCSIGVLTSSSQALRTAAGGRFVEAALARRANGVPAARRRVRADGAAASAAGWAVRSAHVIGGSLLLEHRRSRAHGRFAGRPVEPGGDIVLVHWTGGTDYPLSGDEAAQRFIDATAPSRGSCGRLGPSTIGSTYCAARARPPARSSLTSAPRGRSVLAARGARGDDRRVPGSPARLPPMWRRIGSWPWRRSFRSAESEQRLPALASP